MVVYPNETETNKSQEVALKLLHIKKIRQILFYGNLALIHFQDGIHLGDLVDLDGILNVQQCQKKLLDCPLIYIVAEWI